MTLVGLYRDSVDSFTRTVAMVTPQQWTNPTPCHDWDVRTLVNHVVSEELWTVPLFAGATIAEVGDRFDGDLLGSAPATTAAEAGAQARAVVSEPDALGRTVHLSFGDTPAEEYIRQLFADHLIHGWDLAVAIGADPTLDPTAAHACLTWFTDQEQAYRSAGVIGPAVPVPADASEQDVLLAAFGRDPAAPMVSNG